MEGAKTIKGYELHERIGSGGFGVVHRATQTTVGREVAIKIVLPHFANQPDFIRRFETEAQLIARLEHLHIVPLYDFWRDPDGAYLVMRWLRGGNLRDALANGPFGLEAAALFLDQITSALAIAHRNGVIHRDLKPANILLDEDGNVYLSDFGIAKDTGRVDSTLTRTGMVLGSPDYLSPEQARSEPVTPQTDIYSLGVMLYEVLAGQHPFPNVSSVECMYKHLNEPLPLIETLPVEVADGINAIIQKATAKNPAQRYTDVLAMAADFRRETALNQRSGDSIVEQLTFREQEILQMIVEGCSNKEIAQRLYVTVATVKWHIHGVYQKLRVRSRVQAIVRAREFNLIVSETTAEPLTAESTYIALPEPENPYKGLRAFQLADAHDFFGRERLVQQLLKRLGEHDKLARFLAVVGPSGSGKSSVVKAGLVPALWRGDLPGSERWFVIEMMPGTHPLDELEIALTRVAANQAGNLREHLERDERGLVRVAGLILPDDDSELVIIVDQFEEVFTLVDNEASRVQFIELLHAAATNPRSRVRVIITLRADFYDRPLHYPDFGELVRSRMETVMPLSADELEEAITRPAARVGVSFEPGLVAIITGDVHYQPGALPLLQYALTELFEQRANHTLTHEAYQTLGGATGALAKRAEELYHEHDDAGQEIIRQMFMRLVSLGEGTEDTRRRVPRSELLAVATDEDLMDETLDTYAAYRLLTLDHDPATHRPTVEIAHEAILREWERLWSWLNESRHDIRQQRLLAAAAAEWLRAERDSSYLLRGARLEQMVGWAADTRLALTHDERDFLEAAIAEHARQENAEQKRQQRELETQRQLAEHQRRSANRLRYLVAGLAVFLVAAIVLALFAFNRERQAQEARTVAQQERDKSEREADVNHSLVLANSALDIFARGDPDLALSLALEATRIDQPPSEAVRALSSVASDLGTRALLPGHTNSVKAVAFSPDSRLALSGSCAELVEGTCSRGELILWNIQTATEVRRFEGHTGWVNSVAFSPDGQTALSASSDGFIILWDLRTGEIVRRVDGQSGAINSIVFSPDGQTALSGGEASALILWNVASGEILHRFEGHTGPVNTAVFSPDGRSIASGSADKTIILWDVHSGEIIHRLEGHTSGVTAVGFRPGNTKTLFSTARDSTLREWDIDTGTPGRSTLLAFNSLPLAISPDGRQAVIFPGIGTRLWLIDEWRSGAKISRQAIYVTSGSLSSDGRMILSGYDDGTLRLSNMPLNPEMRRFEADVPLISVDVSPDGRYLLTGSLRGGSAILWDASTGREIRRFEGNAETISRVRFSPDGRYALVAAGNPYGGTDERSLILWDVESGEQVRAFEGHQFYPRCIAFSPDGQTVLTGSMQWGTAWKNTGGGELIQWDVETGQPIRYFDTNEAVLSIDFSVDGRYIVTVSSFKYDVAVWDASTGQLIRRDKSGGAAALVSPDGKNILSTTGVVDLGLSNIETGALTRRFGGEHDGLLMWAAISPDGRYAASGDVVGTIILWDFATGQELQRFTGHPGGVWDIAFSPDNHYVFSSSQDGTVSQWKVIDQSLDEIVAWTHANRYIREFTCEERAQYNIEPLCK